MYRGLAREMCAWAMHGRLVDTITGKPELIPLIHEDVRGIGENVETHSGESGGDAKLETMTAGDFWPGNVLVNLDQGGETLRGLRLST